MFKKRKLSLAVAGVIAVNAALVQAQDQDSRPALEEVLVTGSQIRGADMAGALPVSVLTEDDIALTGAATGDELLRSIPQMGFVGFNESTTTGVNASWADTITTGPVNRAFTIFNKMKISSHEALTQGAYSLSPIWRIP